MVQSPFTSELSQVIWDTKYRYRPHEHNIQDTWWRVAGALAVVEPKAQTQWTQRFYETLSGFRFLPGGRILAGAGTDRRVTLFNCFVMGEIEDSIESIFQALKEGALTLQQGGGVGYDFSTLRPAGVAAHGVGSTASGPVSFMRIWDSMCATMLSTGNRRGAMMATLRCDHPDIEAFIDAKREPRELRHFNLSVQVTDAFMAAVREDREWPLVFPVSQMGKPSGSEDAGCVLRQWSGTDSPVCCRILRTVRARELWEHIMRATYEYAEPGVLFVDRINQTNNLWYCEHISATNPCGEIPLPPYGACDLGSINLTPFVENPFSGEARLDISGIEATVRIATRMLDNVIDVSRFPLTQQATAAKNARRIGLGITGLADALIMLGLDYEQASTRTLAAEVMQRICHAAYRTSIDLAAEKGAFPLFESAKYRQGRFIQALPEDIQQGISTHGIRNSHLSAIAPAGTISLLANNISSGLEPVFDFHYTRRVLDDKGQAVHYELSDFALRAWGERFGNAAPPSQFVSAHRLPPLAHLKMQAALQPYVDNSISKTINVPQDCDFAAFKSIYEAAYERGLKGCTTFRPNPVSGSVLSAQEGEQRAPRCCVV